VASNGNHGNAKNKIKSFKLENIMSKNKKKFLRLLLAASFLLIVGASNQQAGVSQAYTHTDLTDQVDELFKQWDRNDSPGAAVGIFKDGRIIYARGYGIANLEYSLPWTPQTPSRTGSISKQFVGMCIAILAEQGKLSLDDNIKKYFPDWPDYNGPITIKNLLYHTNGIREYLTLVELMGKPEGSGYVYTPKELVRMLARQKELNFKPGEMYSYTNSGYFLLSEIVSRVSGEKTSAFAKKYLFDPLEMKNSHFHDDPNKIVKNRAYGYSPKTGGGYRIDIVRLEVIGDLGVFTTIEDFLKWDQNFYKNKLGKATQELIRTVLTKGKLNNGEDLTYGFGLRIDNYRGLKTISHGGSAVGYQAQYMQFPDQKFSIAILANLSNFPTGRIARQIADLYLTDLFKEPPSPRQRRRRKIPEKISLPVSQLKEYAGKYYSDELDFTYIFMVKNSDLILEIRETLYRLSPYAIESFGWQGRKLDFNRDEKNQVTGFTLEEGIVKNMKFTKIDSE
jgi:CubicO group peptidase (beta-lactamase class C family)